MSAGMQLTQVQNYAIQARVAAIVVDRVFAGVTFAETDGPLLYVYSSNEETAAEIEGDFLLLIVDVAGWVLKRKVELVVVLNKVLQ
jgi:hypothetical protein